MKIQILPLCYGFVTAVTAAVGLWIAVPILITPLAGNTTLLLPTIIVTPPLLLGGFVAAKKMESDNVYNYLLIGGLVGIATMLMFLVIAKTSADALLLSLLVSGGSMVSATGAYLGARGHLKKHLDIPDH